MVDVELEWKVTLKNEKSSKISLVPLNEQLTPKMELKLGGSARECKHIFKWKASFWKSKGNNPRTFNWSKISRCFE